MKKLLCLMLLFSIFYMFPKDHRTKITPVQWDRVTEIGRKLKIPYSITYQLAYEESQFYSDARSDITPEGYRSIGLFQLYTKPNNINYLVYKYWKSSESFDITNPEHNAVVALSYLRDLHIQYGNWYEALLFFNHGDIATASVKTRKYARRIVNASGHL